MTESVRIGCPHPGCDWSRLAITRASRGEAINAFRVHWMEHRPRPNIEVLWSSSPPFDDDEEPEGVRTTRSLGHNIYTS